ncbi:hypothetical protein RM780_22630 [Streptomyces sp. DSM 44917]|uniref:Uncharacterized protein n=1 Tax=Streptomyces boetiae TaxID=3075541 RepID=A0ABU2LDS6_9ACTN|nr:hypothetical protein [Streptomyces sp. DSM 44917]MDT0309730.1 hypothetical protein [Streptomyces sp. DSM 44917]
MVLVSPPGQVTRRWSKSMVKSSREKPAWSWSCRDPPALTGADEGDVASGSLVDQGDGHVATVRQGLGGQQPSPLQAVVDAS